MREEPGTPSGFKEGKTVALIWLFTLLGALAWNISLFTAPASRSQMPALSALIYALFAPLCHQLPERCFQLHGFPLPVCARCLGIYLGFAAGTIFYPFWRGFRKKPSLPSMRSFLLFSLPIGIDAAGIFFRLWTGSIHLRFATGLVWGMILPLYWMAGLSDAAHLVRSRKRRIRTPREESRRKP